MGMFDSVIIFCPECGKQLEFQSKAGECMLQQYDASDVPANIAVDILNTRVDCDCGLSYTITTLQIPSRVTMFLRKRFSQII